MIRTFHERGWLRRFRRELQRRIYTELSKMRQQRIPHTQIVDALVKVSAQFMIDREAYWREFLRINVAVSL